jgi:hypothetical protein
MVKSENKNDNNYAGLVLVEDDDAVGKLLLEHAFQINFNDCIFSSFGALILRRCGACEGAIH